ncbi:MAG: hypothetical protein QOF30_2024, partial [Acidimicrobiaceae bacterium]|nr:hypothetical protein [Acidimicrobiaceae bacterium]
DVGSGEPGQVLAGLGGVGAAALGCERGDREGGGVCVEHLGERVGQVDRGSPVPA